MATAMTFQSKSIVKPPDKGSFPIDHEGECKEYMFKFMKCMRRNSMEERKCRNETMLYLDCRMKHNLMAHEEWKNLGFSDIAPETGNSEKQD